MRLDDRQRRFIIDHALAETPRECCGLVATERGRAVKIFKARNRAKQDHEFELHPCDQMTALREIERKGWKLGAIYHSHPRHSALPSALDVARAQYPKALYLIVSLVGAEPELRAFKIDEGVITVAQDDGIVIA